MTWDPVGWAPRPSPESGGPSAAAAIERAADAVTAARRGLVAADGVAWSTPASVRYRAVLAEAADGVRRAEGRLAAAHGLAARHDVEVTLARDAERRAIEAQARAWLLGGLQ
ncbi:hypothetical protein [Pengzhenrongella sicca]|uniref:Uncharacterized protein n=1 Tax=Pengzhenrongella sicca TaxID=2819238 RepID=A0A8A4ZG41_9MICO|nr:hypothetical protein [Pengzhenrongella sicca]QTE29447.1 hypothetical protein J4E96_19680 [Pengzhenrongella sicca]